MRDSLCLLLTICLCVGFAVPTQADETVDGGYCGDYSSNLTWTLDTAGTLTVSGQGKMGDYHVESTAPWHQYQNDITTLCIQSGVTSIGEGAFYGFSKLTDVTIPDGVTSIGYNAFAYCTGLSSVNITDSVDSIGWGAFEGCDKLTDIKIPDNVTNIGEYAFSRCSNLTSVLIPKNVSNIGWGVFEECSGLTSITVDSENHFYVSEDGVLFDHDRTTLICCPAGREGSYTIPDSVSKIEVSAFSGCSGLSDIVFSSGTATVGSSGVCSIGSSAFAGCTGLTEIVLPASLVYGIGDSAFSCCSGLTAIRVDSDNPAYASEYGVLFNFNKTKLLCCPAGKTGSYSIPEGVNSIQRWAFSSCSGLTDLTIPSSLTDIALGAFDGCTGLNAIHVNPENPLFMSKEGILLGSGGETLICYPAGKMGTHTIPASVKQIKSSAFYDCSNLTTITIPDGVDTIENRAFIWCENLASVIIPVSVTSIGRYAFSYCPSLTDVFYAGTRTQWYYEIFRESDEYEGSDALINAQIHFESIGPEPTPFPSFSSLASPVFSDGTAITRSNVGQLTEITIAVTISASVSQTVTFAVPFFDRNGRFIGMGTKTETINSDTRSVTMPVSGLAGSESMMVLFLSDDLRPLSPAARYQIPG